MHKLSISVSEQDHKMFKIFAAAKSVTLSDLVVQSVKDKISEEFKTPNAETLLAFRDSENDIGLKSYSNIENLIKDLSLDR
jgi:hypothetical protein